MNTSIKTALTLVTAFMMAILGTPAAHAATYIWANSNVNGTPTSPLDWFSGGPNTQGTWTGGTPVTNDNTTTIQFFQDTTTALTNTANPSLQTSNINNGGSAVELGTLTLAGRSNATANTLLTMTISGDALNFSAATGTINLDSVQNSNRVITYNLDSNIQLGTASSASALTITGDGNNTFNINGNITELQSGGGSLIKSGTSTVTLTGTNTYSGGTEINGGAIGVGIANVVGSGNNALGTGTITFIGDSALNTAYGSFNVLDNKVAVNAPATATFNVGTQYYGIAFNGALSGDGNILVTSGNGAKANGFTDYTVGFLSNSNTFTGGLDITGIVGVNSLADSANSIKLGGLAGVSGQLLLRDGAATSLLFNNRQIVLTGMTGAITLANNNSSASNTFTVNTNLFVTGVGAKTLNFAGTNVGANTFSGVIGDGSGIIAITKSGAGRWALSNTANTYTGITTVSAGTLEVTKLADGGVGNFSSIGVSSNAAANLVIGNTGVLRYIGSGDSTDRGFTQSGAAATLDASGTGAINFTNTATPAYGTNNQARTLNLTGTNTDNNTLAAALANNGTGVNILTKSGIGTWVFSGTNSYTGTTTLSGGGQLILDYVTNNTTKLSDTNALVLGGTALGGGTLTLKGGSHTEVVKSTSLNMGGTFITRDTGTSKLNLNIITRVAGGSISFADATIATTDTNNTNGILGGWATIGSNWAKSVDAGAADTAITAFTAYTPFVTATGSSTANYELTGGANLTATVAANSLRIVSDGDDQILDLGNNKNLNITNATVGGLGGILYAGGGNGNYTINGTGTSRVGGTTTNESVINVYTGTLTINAQFAGGANGGAGSSFTKFGAGTLVLGGANGFQGTNAAINEGTVRVTNNSALGSVTGGTIVQNGAALELANSVTIGAEALKLTGTGIANAGALRNVTGNTSSYAGAITFGAGGARINSDASGALTLKGGVTTALFADVTFGGAGDTIVSTAAISGAGNLTKDGAGTLTLSNLTGNTYTGSTTVSNGVLLAQNTSGSATGTGSVLVDSGGGKLGGTGIVGSLTSAPNITIDPAGALMVGISHGNGSAASLLTLQADNAPQNGAGVITLGGMVQFDIVDKLGGVATTFGAVTLNLYNSSSNDQLMLASSQTNSNLLLDNTTSFLDLNVDSGIGSLAAFDAWRIIDWTAFTNSDATGSFSNTLADIGSLSWNTNLLYSDGIIYLEASAAPEPSRAVLMLFGAAGLLMRRRRRNAE